MSDIVQKLWGFCHTLRHDGVDYGDYIEQLTYLLFLKMAEERGVEIPKGCDWDTLKKLSNQKGHSERAVELLPRVHQVFSLLKRWLLGTHQGSVAGEHLQDYLDEFTFRFNHRKSRSRGKLFYRLVQQAVAIEPTTYRQIVDSAIKRK